MIRTGQDVVDSLIDVYHPPANALPTAYTTGSDWYTWQSKYIDGVFVSALVVDRQFWDQDAASIGQFGNLEEFERGTIRGFRFGVAGALKFGDYKVLYNFGGAANGWDRGFDTDETDDFTFFDVRLDFPVAENTILAVGKQKEPISMERQMTLIEIGFLERTTGADSMMPSRNTGVTLQGMAFDQRVSWNAGVFNNWIEQDTSFSNSATQYIGRLTWLPYDNSQKGELVHLGVGGRYTDAEAGLRFKSRPEMGDSVNFIDTDFFTADSGLLYNIEAGWRDGPLWVMAEYSVNDIDSPDFDDPTFTSYYVSTMYTLTGEMRPYFKGKGVFRAVPVSHSVYDGGIGAWEVGARFSSTDLTEGLVEGGEIDVMTLGINWWLTTKFMVGFNAKRSWTDRFGEEGKADMFVGRVVLVL